MVTPLSTTVSACVTLLPSFPDFDLRKYFRIDFYIRRIYGYNFLLFGVPRVLETLLDGILFFQMY